MSRCPTCSCLQKAESIQKAAAAPTMRKVVTESAENSANADLPMGDISPHIMLAVNANACPFRFLSISIPKMLPLLKTDAKVTNLSFEFSIFV